MLLLYSWFSVRDLMLEETMNENLAVTLGELQAQIYWLHDAEKFTELAVAAANIYKKHGFDCCCQLRQQLIG